MDGGRSAARLAGSRSRLAPAHDLGPQQDCVGDFVPDSCRWASLTPFGLTLFASASRWLLVNRRCSCAQEDSWGLWPVLSLGSAGLPIALTPHVEIVVGRSAEFKISARTISRQQLRVTLVPQSGGDPPRLQVAAAQAVYVQRCWADAATPLGETPRGTARRRF